MADMDPMYASVARILQRNHIGAWAEASEEYSRIRRGLIWADLRALLAGPATKANQEKTTELLHELRSVCADLSDNAPTSTTSLAAAEAAVKAWAPPRATPAPAPPKSAKKPVKNSFAALTEDSEEE
jgi:hypothetical protein